MVPEVVFMTFHMELMLSWFLGIFFEFFSGTEGLVSVFCCRDCVLGFAVGRGRLRFRRCRSTLLNFCRPSFLI